MNKEFTDNIEGNSLVLLAKNKEKKKITLQMMDALECCKKHGRPVAPEYAEKLKSFTESEIIAEAVFLNTLT